MALLHGSGHGGCVQHSHCVLLLMTELSVCSGFIFSLAPTGNKTPPILPGVSNPTPPLQLLNSGCFERPFYLMGEIQLQNNINTSKHQGSRQLGRGGNPSPPKVMEMLPSDQLALPSSRTHVVKNLYGCLTPCWAWDTSTRARGWEVGSSTRILHFWHFSFPLLVRLCGHG